MIFQTVKEVLAGIFTGAPIWVWPLLVVLLVVGYLASKPRKTHLISFLFMPLFGLMTVNTISSMPQAKTALTCFFVGYVGGMVAGYLLQSKWLISATGKTIHLSGEWLTMTVVMTIFWANFVGGTLQAVAPAAYDTAIFVGIFALILGLAAGTFVGRGIKTFRFFWEYS